VTANDSLVITFNYNASLYNTTGAIMTELKLFAGAQARAVIARHGLRSSDFSWMAGASGGPKWFVLYGLDRYLAGQFFAGRESPLRLIGSSAGAWRLACYAHPEPVAALDRLAERYSGQVYSPKPDRHEITREARKMLHDALSQDGSDAAADIAGNPLRRLYVIADQAGPLVRSEHPLALNAGLMAAAVANMISRKALPLFFKRVVFHNALDSAAQFPLHDLPTRYIPLQAGNVYDALMASGSIPVVMESVTQVAGADGLVFRDGGITDYHLDLPFHRQQGLVLFPHFYAGVVPGWFDKFAPWHRADPRHFDNVLLVTPSRDFVRSLPGGKIPDRNDFRRMNESERIRAWQAVLAQSMSLGPAFEALVKMGSNVADLIQPFHNHRVQHL
jgi:hypothetical protein